ncbi:DUF5361 domain-containing protein [Nocardia sp. CDC159]|uniref:DUF5361 domain-containing protein n=1 Tax=Nocardia pulmonis TaxID=2951408 RepID=A0A9X2EBF0_9NOCA|nr:MULTISPECIES: DUF5361 domain-containing protein [Nocardia]MCM6777274.1 DUF5361 domain-containing protein [Nocardia pulmonis]MCM6790159.1 DUF5361 domain-containing protein [Nocardia sp. CDC159]
MADAFGSGPGGILSLAALIEEHSEAIEYDLIGLGLRLRQLGTEQLNWRDLKVVVTCSSPDSATARARYPEEHRWQLCPMLLADMADSLRWLVWAKTPDARYGRNRPDPIPRPGVKAATERIGTAASQEEMNDFLGWT